MPHAPNPTDWRIGVDTGGTFTDVVLIDPAGTIHATHKLLSTPDDPGRAVLDGIAHLLSRLNDNDNNTQPASQANAPRVVHGSTVATNALLEGKGDPAALVTTAGFEDVLAIARQTRPDLYATVARRAPPPIPRAMTLGLDERAAFDGAVLTPLQDREIEQAVTRLRALAPAAVVVCLLHSYANLEHERRVAAAVRAAMPGVHLTVSHELLPEMREYERAATCAANAVVAPKMSRYLRKLDTALGPGRLRIMASGGGTLPVDAVCNRPVETVTSGPAGGAIGAWAAAQSAGIQRAVGLDMGGTSTDVTLFDGGPTRTTGTAIADLPIKLPMIDIHTVGAGGGSIARLDVGGALRVGPESAGADPGPACYGRQRGEPTATVTDAHAILGHIADGRRLGDALVVDRDAARLAVGALAQRMDKTPEQAALGILRIADAAMARAVQAVSVERGHDVRAFTLLAFGGAGGLHACRLAEVLGMSRVLLPRHGGLLSAVGMLAAPPRFQFSQAAVASITPTKDDEYPDPFALEVVRTAVDTLTAKGRAALVADGIPANEQALNVSLDLRFAGQSHEITVQRADDGTTAAAFCAEHDRLFGYTPRGRPIEIVTVRLEAAGPTPTLTLGHESTADPASADPQRTIAVSTQQGTSDWPCVARDALAPGTRREGPMIIEEYAATAVIPPGWDLEVLADGQLSATR